MKILKLLFPLYFNYKEIINEINEKQYGIIYNATKLYYEFRINKIKKETYYNGN